MTSTGPEADAARAAFRETIAARGHAVENARAAAARLEEAFASGVLRRTPVLDLMLADLRAVLAAGAVDGAGADESTGDDSEPTVRLGGKSADAARRIGAAIAREIERA